MALSQDTLDKIAQARGIKGKPHKDRFVDVRDVGALLAERTRSYRRDTFLVYYPDDGARVAYTYGEFSDRVAQTVNLLQKNGVSLGDRITTVSQNHADTVVHYFAAWTLGAVIVPINVNEDDDRIRYILANSHVRLAFVREPFLGRIDNLASELPDLDRIIVTGDRASGRPHFDDTAGEPTTFTLRATPDLDTEALIVYTSGTTGNPKGVVLTHYNLIVDAFSIASWHQMTAGEPMMCVLPIHHVNGTIVTLMTPMFYGGSVVLNEKFHTNTFFPRLAAEKVGVVSIVPTLLAFLLEGKAQTEGHDLSRFRHIICGAGPLTVDLAKHFFDRYGIRIVHGYGLSETTCYSCFLPPQQDEKGYRHWMEDFGFPSIGRAISVNEMDIHEADGEPVAAGRRGEIVIRGHNVMTGYFQNDDANTDTFKYGWFRSGDEGFFETDEEGNKYFFITGRLKELIIRGGVNVSTLEIDEILMAIDGVRAGVAVGFENDMYGEEVGAYVVRTDGSTLSEQDIVAECRRRLPHHKCPKVVVFGEEIPVTSTGKYQRNKLKPLFADYRATQFRKTPS